LVCGYKNVNFLEKWDVAMIMLDFRLMGRDYNNGKAFRIMGRGHNNGSF